MRDRLRHYVLLKQAQEVAAVDAFNGFVLREDERCRAVTTCGEQDPWEAPSFDSVP
jgi:hypothetical protein